MALVPLCHCLHCSICTVDSRKLMSVENVDLDLNVFWAGPCQVPAISHK